MGKNVIITIRPICMKPVAKVMPTNVEFFASATISRRCSERAVGFSTLLNCRARPAQIRSAIIKAGPSSTGKKLFNETGYQKEPSDERSEGVADCRSHAVDRQRRRTPLRKIVRKRGGRRRMPKRCSQPNQTTPDQDPTEDRKDSHERATPSQRKKP